MFPGTNLSMSVCFCGASCQSIRTVRDSEFVRNDEGVIVFNFGRYKGQPALFQKDYRIWMLKGDFTADTKEAIRQILNEAMKQPDFTADK